MRLIGTLRARANAVYDEQYHHKLRGRMWRALDGTEFESLHNENRPMGLSFSNPFPPRDLAEGDRRTLLVAAPQRDLLEVIATDLATTPELNVGEMPFDVEDVSLLAPDVGEPGTRGVLETGTGVLVRIPPWRAEEYPNVETDGEHGTFWLPEHTVEPLKQQLEANLDRKHDLFCPDDLPGPSDLDGDLFDSYELIKTFALPTTVTQGVEQTLILSKWRFGYDVRDDHHRRHLNLALDTGIGERNALGFGFLNIDEDARQPAGRGRGTAETESSAPRGGG